MRIKLTSHMFATEIEVNDKGLLTEQSVFDLTRFHEVIIQDGSKVIVNLLGVDMEPFTFVNENDDLKSFVSNLFLAISKQVKQYLDKQPKSHIYTVETDGVTHKIFWDAQTNVTDTDSNRSVLDLFYDPLKLGSKIHVINSSGDEVGMVDGAIYDDIIALIDAVHKVIYLNYHHGITGADDIIANMSSNFVSGADVKLKADKEHRLVSVVDQLAALGVTVVNYTIDNLDELEQMLSKTLRVNKIGKDEFKTHTDKVNVKSSTDDKRFSINDLEVINESTHDLGVKLKTTENGKVQVILTQVDD